MQKIGRNVLVERDMFTTKPDLDDHTCGGGEGVEYDLYLVVLRATDQSDSKGPHDKTVSSTYARVVDAIALHGHRPRARLSITLGDPMDDKDSATPRRVVAITGAASGIGLACAQRFTAGNDIVVMLDIDAERVHREASTLNATAYTLDVRSGESVGTTFAAIVSEVGPIDVLVNNAGIGVAADLLSSSWEDWQRTFDVNVHSMFHTCRAVLPRMLEHGAGIIVNTASVAGLVGIRDRAAYCTSKSAVIGFTRALTADYAHRGIRANAVCPGTVATEWIGKILANAKDPVAKRLSMEQRQLDGQMGSPQEVAAAIWFLASPEGRFANGSAMVIDGGWTAM